MLTNTCRTCPFNQANDEAGGREPWCSLRDFFVVDPAATTCFNHPLHNPLRLRELRGPVWALAEVEPEDEPEFLPPDLLPPVPGTWLPFFDRERPDAARAACEACGAMENVVLIHAEGEALTLCPRDYWQWWWEATPVEAGYWDLTPIDDSELTTSIGMMLEWVPEAARRALDHGDVQGALETLRGFDEVLRRSGVTRLGVLLASQAAEDCRNNQPVVAATLDLWAALAEVTALPERGRVRLLEARAEALFAVLMNAQSAHR